MTLPFERYRSVEKTREFLLALLDPRKTPRVPLQIRKEARKCLKHFPGFFHMERAQQKDPDTWGEYEKPHNDD